MKKPLIMQCQLFLRNAMQAAAVLYYICNIMNVSLCCAILSIVILFTRFYFISLLYSVWYIYDLKTPNHGGRRWPWFRNLKLWTYFCDYFPIRVIKTCDLPPTQNYLMCYHPHGILCMGAFACFATEATNFKKEFPGLTARILTLEAQLRIPYYREQVLGIGACTVLKESIEWLLSKERTGNASCLIVGGAAEMLEAHPQTVNLVLKRRKGFIKLALKHGASLVPVFAFGENEIFCQVENPPGSRLRNFQNKVAQLIGFPCPFAYGRLGTILPFRRPITVVIGKPINLDEVPNPSQDQIDATQELYITALKDLFETHKLKYGRNLKLNII